jgi:asparagine synthase (glutamine-hydrolysing)
MNHFRIVIEKSKLAAKPDYFLNDIMMDIATICDEDSLFIRQDGNAVLFMGLCFNKRKVLAQNNATEWVSLASRRLIDSPKAFLAQLDGSFCGFLYKGSDHSLILFSDHLASQPIYFYIDDKHCIIDTNLILLADAMRHYHKPIKVSELGGYYMLAYSFMLDDITPINGVYKVKPSTLFSVDNQQLIEYCQFYQEDKIIDCRIEDIADSIHDRFSEAVKSTFAIDGKHRHLISLSGGLDSRMCLFYAINQGATDISTLCYSQSFYREEVIAKKISAEHNCEHIFFGLDNGKYLSNIDTGIIATQGMTTYRPILSARMIWEKLRMDRFGLVHTGLLGDAIIGGYCIGKCGQSDRFISALDFAFQLNPKNKSLLHAKYKNEILPFLDDILDWIPSDKLLSLKSEKFILENRYFNGLGLFPK